MRFNDKYFSFPPFISTSWNHVAALHFNETVLILYLTTGHAISIPSLKPDVVELIFKAHNAYLEKEGAQTTLTQVDAIKTPANPQNILLSPEKMGDLPLRLGINPLDGMSTLQHNQAMANAPDLPKDLIQKIASITKIVAGDEAQNLPKAEPHCNCFYCQIARGLQQNAEHEEPVREVPTVPTEEIVSDSELRFEQWEIKQCGEKLFSVTNKLDTLENYRVFLGHPVGCTCGHSGCEHIEAVLRT